MAEEQDRDVRRKGDGLCCAMTKRGRRMCRRRGTVTLPPRWPGDWFVYCPPHAKEQSRG